MYRNSKTNIKTLKEECKSGCTQFIRVNDKRFKQKHKLLSGHIICVYKYRSRLLRQILNYKRFTFVKVLAKKEYCAIPLIQSSKYQKLICERKILLSIKLCNNNSLKA